ncbi:hypothetical protein CJ030_MR2G000504 [Morella rubra]|uniref:Uncharacterized protein n=1 Tax=Morella rubra TaxID=262757 RepID=A0A6A1WF57_9ROSI|nr:hypothetical protein CJ030_MR2G000504 [Morella rubra]
MSVANAPFVGNARPAVHDMAVDDATTNPTESQFGGHATEMETEASKKGKGKGKAGGTAYQLAGRATKATKGKSKAATVGGSASQRCVMLEGWQPRLQRTSSSQPTTGIASRIRAHQAERRASERLRGYVGSGQPAREPIMVDLTIEEAAQKREQVFDVHGAILEPGGRESSLQQLLYLP